MLSIDISMELESKKNDKYDRLPLDDALSDSLVQGYLPRFHRQQLDQQLDQYPPFFLKIFMVYRDWQFAKFYPNTVGIRSAVGLQ